MTNSTHDLTLLDNHWKEVKVPMVVCSWIILAGLAKMGFHEAHRRSKNYIPECCLLIVLGCVVGLITRLASIDVMSYFTPHIFFIFILPPIVLEAGYLMPKDAFINNLGTILTYSFIGTLFCTFATGLSLWLIGQTGQYGFHLSLTECLLFGSIISAVDPAAVITVFEEIHVNLVLYICVFGESILNDGVAVVLYRVFTAFLEMGPDGITLWSILLAVLKIVVVAGGGTILGVVFGLIGSFITKYTIHVRMIEPTFVFATCFVSYLTAECFGFSSILAIVFCAFTMNTYVEHNVSDKSHTTIKYGMKMFSNVCEVLIFMFLGIAAISDFWRSWNTAFTLWTVFFITIYRFISVYGLTAILNRYRIERITRTDQFVMAYGGLRGGIAFALIKVTSEETVPKIDMMLCSTLVVIFLTSFIQGATIQPMVNWLHVKLDNSADRPRTMHDEVATRAIDHIVTGIEDIIGEHGRHWWMHKMHDINARYIKPILTHDCYVRADEEIIEIFHRINLRDATALINKADRPKDYRLSRKEEQIADLMVHNIKHDYDKSDKDPHMDIIRGHMYPTRKTLRRREIMRDRPGYTAHCRVNELERNELLMRRRIRDIKHNSQTSSSRHHYQRRQTIASVENDRFADDEYDEESIKAESSTSVKIEMRSRESV